MRHGRIGGQPTGVIDADDRDAMVAASISQQQHIVRQAGPGAQSGEGVDHDARPGQCQHGSDGVDFFAPCAPCRLQPRLVGSTRGEPQLHRP